MKPKYNSCHYIVITCVVYHQARALLARGGAQNCKNALARIVVVLHQHPAFSQVPPRVG